MEVVYGLFVILQPLFRVRVDSDNALTMDSSENRADYKMIVSKYRELTKLLSKMNKQTFGDTPTADEIFGMRDLWALFTEQFDSKNVFKKIMNSENYEYSYVYKLLRKYLITAYSYFDYVNPVEQETEIEGFNCYPMNAYPRGKCFIINNVEQLVGESERFEDVFKELYFEVKLMSCLSTGQILTELESIAKDESLASTQALIVMIICQGSDGDISGCEDSYQRNNINSIKISQIFEIFADKNCPNLKHIPKLLFINCVSDKINSISSVGLKLKNLCIGDSTIKARNDSIQKFDSIDDELINANKNTFMCYICSENKWDPIFGISYSGLSLSRSIEEFAHKHDLETIVNHTFDYMMIFSENKKEFDFEIRVHNMEKLLFFNPGYSSQQSDSE